MGWLMLAVVGGAAALLLRLIGVGKDMWAFAGAALMLGAIGYTVQGSPSLPGHPVKADAAAVEVDPALVELRWNMFGRVSADAAFMTGSDAYVRGGDLKGGAEYAMAGLRQNPDSAMLWTGLGVVLAQHDGGTLSPPALFAFRRAVTLAPEHPGPYFFLGVADIRAGELGPARAAWAQAVKLTPADASYRGELVERLALLDRFIAANNGGQGMAPPAAP